MLCTATQGLAPPASSRANGAGGLFFFPTEHGGWWCRIHSSRQERIKMNVEQSSGDSFPIVFCSRHFPQNNLRIMVLRSETSKQGD
ncbi:hypothetical protein LEMLEM_LOCUS7305 [Lemmus lemmus]